MDRRLLAGGAAVVVLAVLVGGAVVLTTGTEDAIDQPSDAAASTDDTDEAVHTEVVWDVEWSEGVTVIGAAERDLVLDADADDHRYRLDAAGVTDANVDVSPGRVLVIHGTALRRIADVREENGELIVETEFATLPEAIEEGTIEWEHEVRFQAEHFQAAARDESPVQFVMLDPAGRVVEPTPVQEGQALEFQFDMEGYQLTYRIVPQGDSLEVEIVGEKDMGQVGARVSARGVLESFESSDRIVIEGGELQEYDNNLERVRGELDLELVVAASGSDRLNFTLPTPILSYTFLVGYIPVTVNIDTQFIINMEVPADGSSRVTGSFSFDSDLGFRYEGVDVESDGSLALLEQSSDTHETGASSPISANFGIGFPRIQLGLFGNLVVPWAQTAFLVGGSFTVMRVASGQCWKSEVA